MVKHEWKNTTVFTNSTCIGGQSDGPTALGGMTLGSLTDLFATGLEDNFQDHEILDIVAHKHCALNAPPATYGVVGEHVLGSTFHFDERSGSSGCLG